MCRRGGVRGEGRLSEGHLLNGCTGRANEHVMGDVHISWPLKQLLVPKTGGGVGPYLKCYRHLAVSAVLVAWLDGQQHHVLFDLRQQSDVKHIISMRNVKLITCFGSNIGPLVV